MSNFKHLLKFVFVVVPLLIIGQVSFIPISADFSVFDMNDSLAYVEIYTSFFQSQLQYDYKNDTLFASFENTLLIKNNGNEYKKITHNFRNTIKDSSKINKYAQFFDIFKITLPFKHFSATMHVKDNISAFSGEYLLDLNIPGSNKDFYLSNIQLASNIQNTSNAGKFVKNGLDITPFPRKVFDLLQPMLYFYIELNNLSYNPIKNNRFSFNYLVTNENGDTVKTSTKKSKEIAGKAQVEIGAFNALSLPTGIYHLNIHAQDLFSGTTSNSSKRFFVNKPTNKKETKQKLSEIDPVFSSMTIEEMRLEFDAARYFASSQERKIFEQLVNVNELRVYLTSFWRNQDKNNGSAFGKSRERLLRLIEIANEKYGSSMKKGYKTDRGRVLILYGAPNEVERFTNNTDTEPYLIWTYFELDGGSDFIFGDRYGFGKYELLHSTYYKELQNPNWHDLLLISNYKRTND